MVAWKEDKREVYGRRGKESYDRTGRRITSEATLLSIYSRINAVRARDGSRP